MNARIRRLSTAGFAGLLLVGLVAACEQTSSPRQVQASNPTVTYKYRNDRDLMEANQRAATFCNQYQSVPRTVSIGNGGDGDRIAVFECVQSGSSAALVPQTTLAPVGSSMTYTYRTDRELLDASRTAQAYCANRGSPQMNSNVITNANGSRTVTFQCG